MADHPSPGAADLAALARVCSTPFETLAAELGCSKLEAARIGIRAAAELLPWINKIGGFNG